MNVLFSNPSLDEEKVWLPYTWGRFREYCEERSPHDLSAVKWLDPIYMGYWNDITEVEREYDLSKVDVLMLSMYVWNVDRNIQIAKMTKKANPNCVILAGGPHACHKPWQLDEIERYEGLVDWITPWEGEEPLANFLHGLLNDLPVNEKEWVDPKKPRLLDPLPRLELKGVKHSPYKLYFKDYKRFAERIRSHKSHWVGAIFESNRGCPYKCSYCDWGSLIASKIKIYPKQMTMHDFEVFSELKINFVFSMDANFGIFKEDLENTRYMIELNKKTGWPREFTFCANKNKKEISNQAFVELFYAQMNPGAQINFQHTDQEVLEAIDRDNIKEEKFQEEMQLAYEHKFPMVGAVIIGMPNDTVEKWKNNFDYLMEVGFHEDMRVHDFMVLPNAPAAHPDYLKKYGIETVNRADSFSFKAFGEGNKYYAKFITATNTFTRDDFVEMHTWTNFVMGTHHMNISRFLAMYCNQFHGIKYRDFYDKLMTKPIFKKVYDALYLEVEKWIYNKKDNKMLMFEGLEIPFDLWVKCNLITKRKDIMPDLIEIMEELTGLNREICIDAVKAQMLSYVSWRTPLQFNLHYNFPQIFGEMYFDVPKNVSSRISLQKTKTRSATIKNFIVNYQTPISQKKYVGKPSREWISRGANHLTNRRQGMNHYHESFDL